MMLYKFNKQYLKYTQCKVVLVVAFAFLNGFSKVPQLLEKILENISQRFSWIIETPILNCMLLIFIIRYSVN